ncbi:MAG: replication-associated recombination protein A [Methylicorpusculum sp.]|uniref:replication-associated recombination protein A n=1 Tax=Methylicorpusculum sp. TaxID=2713644 RepID=UPI00271D67E4|nr:replication-associated recombination protein A [Methylicorpusculum sp.]MDO8846296.1 replication-associated recombination protein A [Methylicorpusculum sp.]MDO8940481.1 replication-associated recombination protein A [Methylicorpusculum sp.]MDO9240171.1 replication-associated recombination protein A [Methylicorpusculum sp.]MDP2178861.1 replication-associated recombination protein A [Methylicorpusculum sp.]MDP2203699.1 replication-associated recombination protein A [Methylicorpusculum sp.]
MRPAQLDEYSGQRHLLSSGKPLYEAIAAGRLHSMIFWGPPGTGKTTLARMIANHSEALFIPISAVLAGVKEIRAAVAEAQAARESRQQRTILFVDEVHRFNKAQQDAFLPHVEDGTFYFIGATTENPSFALNNALLSRARVYVLNALSTEDLLAVLNKALTDKEKGLGHLAIEMDEAIKHQFAAASDGDARRALNLLEIAVELAASQNSTGINEAIAKEVLSGGTRRFDKQGEEFYNQISALHKSVRGSSPDAALYWLCRMMDAGCDLAYLARRIVRIASEDIGNADPRALPLAISAWEAQERLGSPEGELALAHAVVYLACAAKSNAVYRAYNAAMRDAKQSGSLPVPVHLRNAPTSLMKSLDYGNAYRYAHDEPDAYAAGENYFPENLKGSQYYTPVNRGLEIKIAEKLKHLRNLDKMSRTDRS